jgi:hypothetical protein
MMGFELIVLLYGHTNAENINAHEQAAWDYMRNKKTRAKVLCLNDVEPAVKHGYKVADHAAKWETSFMMASCPNSVRMKSIPVDHGKFWGLDPRIHASAKEGERMYGLIAKEVSKLVKTAFSSSKASLLKNRFIKTSECWKKCRNYSDLKSNYWKGDEKWEDPFCIFCIWRSKGAVKALTDLKGKKWMKRRMRLWKTMSSSFTCRLRYSFKELNKEAQKILNH